MGNSCFKWTWLATLFISSIAWASQWGMKISDPPSGPGAQVTAVLQGGPATQAGLQPGE